MFNAILEEEALVRTKRLYRVTPSVLDNVWAANSYDYYYVATADSVFTATNDIEVVQRDILIDWGKDYDHIVDTYVGSLLPPQGDNQPAKWQWLGGIGYGAWYDLEPTDKADTYRVSQYVAGGTMIFSAEFKADNPLDISGDYTFLYPSTYASVYLIVADREERLSRVIGQ